MNTVDRQLPTRRTRGMCLDIFLQSKSSLRKTNSDLNRLRLV